MPSVTRTKREPLEWTYDGRTWLLLPDAPGTVPFMEPDELGRFAAPTSVNFDEFLGLVIAPDQQAELLEAAKACDVPIEDRGDDHYDLPPPERFDMAVAAWKNTMRYAEVENEQSVALRMFQGQNNIMREMIAKAQRKAQETAAAASSEGDTDAPLED